MTQTNIANKGGAESRAVIGVPQLTAYYLSNLIGAGIFVLPALSQQLAGSWTLLAWSLMVVCAGPTAWVMGRISIDFPNRNGILAFVDKVVSPQISRGLSLLIVTIMILGNPIMGVISARYAIAAFGLEDYWLYELAACFMLLSVAFNFLGFRNSANLQTALVAVAMFMLMLLAALSLNGVDAAKPIPTKFESTGFFAAIGICFFAYLGWENVATIAPDVKRPERTFSIALLISVPLIGLIYLMIALALLVTSQSSGGLEGNLAVLDHLISPFNSPQLSVFVNVLALVVVVLSTNAWVLSAGRLLSSGVRDGHLPAPLADEGGAVGRKTLLWLSIFYLCVILLMSSLNSAEELIVPLVSAGFMLVYLFTLLGASRHYRGGRTGYCATFALGMIVFFALSIWIETLLVALILLLFTVSSRSRLTSAVKYK